MAKIYQDLEFFPVYFLSTTVKMINELQSVLDWEINWYAYSGHEEKWILQICKTVDQHADWMLMAKKYAKNRKNLSRNISKN